MESGRVAPLTPTATGHDSLLLDDPLLVLSHSMTIGMGADPLGYASSPSTSASDSYAPGGPVLTMGMSECLEINNNVGTSGALGLHGLLPPPHSHLGHGSAGGHGHMGSLRHTAMQPSGPCRECGEEITCRTFLMIDDKSFHEACARCAECRRPLDGKCFYRDGLLLCKTDYAIRWAPQCERCRQAIECQQLVMNVRDVVFHLHCFNCVVCGEMLRQGDKFSLGQNGALTCYQHLDPVYGVSSHSSMLGLEHPAVPSVVMPPASVPSEPAHPLGKIKRSKTVSIKTESPDDERDSSPERNPGQKTKRMRTSFKHHQLREMKRYFGLNHNPDAKDLKQLAQKTGLTKRVLQVWFQNARAKFRRNTANNPNATTSPNGCILPHVPQQRYQSETSGSGSSARTSTSPFEHAIISDSYSVSPDGTATLVA